MGQYIIFERENYKGEKGYLYQKGTKFKIKSQDNEYYYVMSDEIQKDKLEDVEYSIGDIMEGR